MKTQYLITKLQEFQNRHGIREMDDKEVRLCTGCASTIYAGNNACHGNRHIVCPMDLAKRKES